MTAALLWKEYRQQRAIWLVIAALATIVVVGVAEVLGKGSGLEVFRDGHIVDILYGAVVALAMAQGIVTGAALLAGDKEDGTLGFLEGLTGLRGPLFARKLAAGVMLTLSQSLFLAVLALCLGFGTFSFSRNVLLLLPLVALDGLIWGLLAGALCRTVLIAILVGFALMAASWPLAPFAMELVDHLLRQFDLNVPRWLWSTQGWRIVALPKTVAALVVGFGSWRIYCRSDLSRRQVGTPFGSRLFAIVPAEWRVMLWLVFRQGRWVLCGCFAGAVLLACIVEGGQDILWPAGALLLGLTCGLAAFAPDSKEGNQFLAGQRFTLGKLWSVKVVFWGAVAAGTTYLAQKGLVHLTFWDGGDFYWVIWPIYGFCFGQFFGLVAGRPIASLILALFITPLVTTLWAPSLYLGGVALWQILIIPALLLVCTRLAMRPAVAGRLLTVRPAIGIACTVGLSALTTAGFFWYRTVEIPDVGEPFDVKAFTANMPTEKDNKAGRLLAGAAKALAHRLEELGENKTTMLGPFNKFSNILVRRRAIDNKLDEVQLQQIGLEADLLFPGKWAEIAHEAARLPLGMVQNPRTTDMSDVYYFGSGKFHDFTYLFMARCFLARALQLQAKGDLRGALDHLETTLGLSRQVKNYATSKLYRQGCEMEALALEAYQRWLDRLGPDKELLKAGLKLLERHEAAAPDPANTVKADYLVRCNGLPRLGRRLINILQNADFELPWERQRRVRIDRVVTLARLRECQKSPRQIFESWQQIGRQNDATMYAMTVGLPIEEASGLSIRQWTEAMICTSGQYYTICPWFGDAINRRTVHGYQLVTALALYQADLGKPPAKLEELCPNYLPVFPIDSFRGEPFEYTIVTEKGFDIPTSEPIRHWDKKPTDWPVGQAVVWAKMDRVSGLQSRSLFHIEVGIPSVFEVPMGKE